MGGPDRKAGVPGFLSVLAIRASCQVASHPAILTPPWAGTLPAANTPKNSCTVTGFQVADGDWETTRAFPAPTNKSPENRKIGPTSQNRPTNTFSCPWPNFF